MTSLQINRRLFQGLHLNIRSTFTNGTTLLGNVYGRHFCVSDDTLEDHPKSYYDILEVSRTATHEEIKTAYYNLSKTYHPDVNKDSPDAAIKFQEITDAYEILGNYYLRKKYDKGILHGVLDARQEQGGITDHHIEHEKFFASRLHHSSSGGQSKTTKFDASEFTKAHYSKTVLKEAAAKKRREAQRIMNETEIREKQVDLMFLMIFGFILLAAGLVNAFSSQDDKNKRPTK